MKRIQNTHPRRKTITTSAGMLRFGEQLDLPDKEADFIVGNEHGVEVSAPAKKQRSKAEGFLGELVESL